MAMTAHTRSLILRVEATNLQQLKDDLMTMTGPMDHWRSIGYGGTLETADGRKVELSGCDGMQSAEKYRGRAHDAKFWDEVCQFSEPVFRFVNAWCRTADPDQRCRVVATGNPPARPEEEWVIKYWGPWLDSQNQNPAEPGELRWFASIGGEDVEVESGAEFDNGGERIRPRSRTFIPARLEDNPILEATGYRAALQGLPEPLRSQLLYGDMTVGRDDDEWQVLPTRLVRAAMRRWKKDGAERERPDAGALDVAMGGSDRLVLAKRYGNWVAPLKVWKGREVDDGNKVVDLILPHLEWAGMPLLVDMLANPGGEAVRALRDRLTTTPVRTVNFGVKSEFRDKSGRLGMANLRAEAYWRLREAVEAGTIALPEDPELLTELCSVRWKPIGGKVQIEKKDEIRDRLGRSTDKADAVAMLALTLGAGAAGWLMPRDEKPGRPKAGERPFSYTGGYAASSGFMGVGGGED